LSEEENKIKMACGINDDWEHHVVNPLLQDMHCGDEEYFNTQDVSVNLNFKFFIIHLHTKMKKKKKCTHKNCYFDKLFS
jgi:hypothetical protein